MSHCCEGKLKPAVVAWLLSRNMTPVFEAWRCDVVGVQFSPKPLKGKPALIQAIGIELKLHDAGGVLSQAVHNKYRFPFSWVAMPIERARRMKSETLGKFFNEGIGFLVVDGDKCDVVFEATRTKCLDIERLRNNLWIRQKEYPKRVQ